MLKELSLPKSLLEGVKTSSTARCFFASMSVDGAVSYRKAAQLNVLRISGICYIIRISCQIFYYKVSENFFQERILQHLYEVDFLLLQ